MDTSVRPVGPKAGWWRLAGLLLAAILIPFALLAGPLEAWSAELMAWRPDPVIGFLVVAVLLWADIVLPVPSSVVLVYAGVALGPWWGAAASTLGLTLSLLSGYGLGRLASLGLVQRVLNEEQREQLERAFHRWGPGVVSATRPVPVLAEGAAFLAGLARWNLRAVAGWGLLANLGVALLFAGAGAWSARLQSPGLAWLASMVFPALAWLGFRFFLNRPRAAS